MAKPDTTGGPDGLSVDQLQGGGRYLYLDQTRTTPTAHDLAPGEVTQADSNPAFYPPDLRSPVLRTTAEQTRVDTDEATATAITVTPASKTLTEGQTQQLAAAATMTAGADRNVLSMTIWTTSDAEVALVNKAGLVTAVAEGTATITGSYGSMTDTVAITVEAPVTLESIAVNPTSKSLAALATQQLTVTATMSDTSTEDVTADTVWVSANEAVATVDEAGLVTAVAAGGPTDITGTYQGETVVCAVTVTG